MGTRKRVTTGLSDGDLAAAISSALERASDAAVARKAQKQIQTLRGVRGTPLSEVARLTALAWEQRAPALPAATDALNRLYGTAWEDGLAAVGLLSAALPDDPAGALALGLQWAERLDEVGTADALGWLVLGPAALIGGEPVAALGGLLSHERVATRRAAVMAAMAWLPVPIEGPAAAAVRARLGQRHAQWVDAAHSPHVAALADARVRDEAPEVRKGLRRVLRAWADADPVAVAEWGAAWQARGGLPRLLSDEVERARRRAERA